MDGVKELFNADSIIQWRWLIAMLINAGLMAWTIGRIYKKYGSALSNRSVFAHNFMPLAMTTALIIAIVKSSLALSLGLVGALSIVRFRSAIKEPEELVYLFLVIAVGLGAGATNADSALRELATLWLSVGIILAAIVFFSAGQKAKQLSNFHLTVHQDVKKAPMQKILEVVASQSRKSSLKRFDESKNSQELSFIVEFDSASQVAECKDALQKTFPGSSVTFLEYRSLA